MRRRLSCETSRAMRSKEKRLYSHARSAQPDCSFSKFCAQHFWVSSETLEKSPSSFSWASSDCMNNDWWFIIRLQPKESDSEAQSDWIWLQTVFHSYFLTANYLTSSVQKTGKWQLNRSLNSCENCTKIPCKTGLDGTCTCSFGNKPQENRYAFVTGSLAIVLLLHLWSRYQEKIT